MSLRTFAASLLFVTATVLPVLAGCSSSSDASGEGGGAGAGGEGGVCGAASAWKDKCATGASECDETIITTCSDVTSVLNPTLLDGAKTCIEQASCGTAPTSCFAQAISGATPTDAHKKLAEGFCGCLVTGEDACVAAIDSNDGPAKAALAVALPLSDDLANAITDSCTGSLGCAATFSACAQGVIAKKLAETLSVDAAKCLAESILDGAKESVDGGGDPSCTAKTCDDFGGECGDHDDGCGGTVSCGKCQEACTPKTCKDLGKTCGTAPDGCGGTVSCGKCDTGTPCTDKDEPNETNAAAKDLGTLKDSPDSSAVVDALTAGDGDEDWFSMTVTDSGLDGNPVVDVSATGNLEIGVFFVCDSGGDGSYCPDGDTQDNTIGKGCRGTHDVVLDASCSGLTDSGKAFVRVRKTASDGACTPYTLTALVH
jgi:hypothetical protein